LDTNGDGKASRAEWKEFYRRAGFTPVVVRMVPAAVDSLRVSEILFRQLDRDGDGQLSKAELEQAPALLRRFDMDEDEVLTAAEILDGGAGVVVRAPERSPVETASSGEAGADAILKLAVGKGQSTAPVTWAEGICTAGMPRSATPLRATTEFYLALFRSAAGEKAAVELKDLEDDPTFQALASLLPYADRNGDGKLTRAELEAFLALIELGAGCRVQVTVTTRGRNLFDLLDANGDGRLDLRELNRAAQVPAGLRREGITQRYHLQVDRTAAGSSFGPVALAGASKRTPGVPVPGRRGPRWFQAMDRNGDGYLSPREFLGSPEQFRLLDTDGDGLISVEEAEKAQSQKSR
jgi:Ca2+-binding EF-hand superfamily protein